MTREDADFIGAMNMCDEISDEAYKKIMCHCEEQEPCDDAISREVAIRWVKTECNPYGKPTLDFESGKKVIEHLKQIPSVTPKQKTLEWTELKDQKPEDYADVLVRNIDGDVTCAYLCDDTDFLERFSGEKIDDVVEWMEMPV